MPFRPPRPHVIGYDATRADVVMHPETIDRFVFQEMAEDVYRAQECLRADKVVRRRAVGGKRAKAS